MVEHGAISMALNIKNEEAHALAVELAALTGESMTTVVLDALRAQRALLQRRLDADARFQELMAIGARCADHIHTPVSALDHGSLLFDEQTGMPA